jgi:hypothetical protein
MKTCRSRRLTRFSLSFTDKLNLVSRLLLHVFIVIPAFQIQHINIIQKTVDALKKTMTDDADKAAYDKLAKKYESWQAEADAALVFFLGVCERIGIAGDAFF